MEANEKQDRSLPDLLLKKISRENRGKLTVFLGAIAGVGKTFAMLKAAHEKQAEGKNIVIGWVETHGRCETEELVNGLPRMFPRQMNYKGRIFTEMDTDHITESKPDIVLVDELAHTNVQGSRHVRRYQDVEEILSAGIDVYTTINIQHVESLNDIVAKITGVVVRETVPDYVIQMADRVQLIDLPSEDLLQRLQEGKIYVPQQAEKALKNFFRQGNVNALRELSLRFTAKHVDESLADYMAEHRIEGPWPVSGKVMVCISGSPFSAHLLRAANQLATGLRSELLAVHIEIENPKFPIGEKERERIIKNMRLAEDLGAKTSTVLGNDLVDEILTIARKQNVTAIVVGKPLQNPLQKLFRKSVVDEIIQSSGDINVYVIHGKEEPTALPIKKSKRQMNPWTHISWSLGMVILTTVICWHWQMSLQTINIAFLYILPVLLSALWWGRWPSYASAIAGMLAFDFYFIDPVMTFSISDVRYIWSFIIFFVLSAIIGGRTEKLHQENRQTRQRERSIRAVYEFSREIAAVGDVDRIAASLARQAGENVDRKVLVILVDGEQKMGKTFQYDPQPDVRDHFFETPPLSRAELAVAEWVYKNKEAAGWGTETLTGTAWQFRPVGNANRIFAVFGVDFSVDDMDIPEQHLLDAWERLAAISMERAYLAEEAQRSKLFFEADRLRNAIFNSISHELKTPLAAVLGSVAALMDGDAAYTEADRRELLLNVQEGSLRMERLIANLLDTARLESGMMKIKEDWCDLEEIVGSVLLRGESFLRNHQVTVELAPALPFIKGDCVLLEQVLLNLLDNAVKYSAEGTKISICVQRTKAWMEISIFDQGQGIDAAEIHKIFDKFYRGKHKQKISGTGLGLAICKGIVEAHHGEILARQRSEGGMMFSVRLPLENDRVREKEVFNQ